MIVVVFKQKQKLYNFWFMQGINKEIGKFVNVFFSLKILVFNKKFD